MPRSNSENKEALKLKSEREDQADLASRFKQRQRVQIPDFLEPDSAQRIYRALSQQVEWNLAWNDQGQHTDLSLSGVLDWTEEQRALLDQKIYRQAATGFQYCYAAIPIYDIYQNNSMPGHFFNEIYELMNKPVLINFVREVTGLSDVKFADLQATRYLPGHFLTEHDDDVQGKNRLAAYVLNLTPDWRPDWGGALIFTEGKDGENACLFPTFNALNIFAVPQKHAVSMVAPFAQANRYSITGWFRY